MAKSNYAENAALTALLPGTLYVALCSSAPTDAQTGSNIPELSGNGYSRQSTTFTVSGSTATNAATLTYTASGGAWTAATHLAIVSASSGGNVIYYGALNNSLQLNNGEAGQFAVGQIAISED